MLVPCGYDTVHCSLSKQKMRGETMSVEEMMGDESENRKRKAESRKRITNNWQYTL